MTFPLALYSLQGNLDAGIQNPWLGEDIFSLLTARVTANPHEGSCLPRVPPGPWCCPEPASCFRGEPFGSSQQPFPRGSGRATWWTGTQGRAHFSGPGLSESWGRGGGGCNRRAWFTGSQISPSHHLSPIPSSSAGRNVFLTIHLRGWEDREGEGCLICNLQPGAETGQAPPLG